MYQCLLACVFEKMGAFSADGRLLNGDNVMPIMDRLYGFKEYQTVLRAQLVHNCVDQGNDILIHVYVSKWLPWQRIVKC
jgi:hypothetical protein